MEIEITIHCSICSDQCKQTITLPNGWGHRYGGIDDEQSGFCPKHAKIQEWAASQCPGCTGGWGDCPLFTSFAYSENKLTADDHESIQSGICPKRVNGTFAINQGEFSEINLSETAPSESGVVLSNAIKDYCKKYHKQEHNDG